MQYLLCNLYSYHCVQHLILIASFILKYFMKNANTTQAYAAVCLHKDTSVAVVSAVDSFV